MNQISRRLYNKILLNYNYFTWDIPAQEKHFYKMLTSNVKQSQKTDKFLELLEKSSACDLLNNEVTFQL